MTGGERGGKGIRRLYVQLFYYSCSSRGLYFPTCFPFGGGGGVIQCTVKISQSLAQILQILAHILHSMA